MDGVAHYYDRNTPRFLLMGRGCRTYAIHRELWGPGATSAREAARYIDGLVADEIDAWVGRPVRHVLDFGCGVGGTLVHLAERLPDARLHGVTISARQVELAGRILRQEGLPDRCTVTRGDFHSANLGMRADAIVAIESLAHSADVTSFLGNAARHLAPGGVLVIADDFLATEESALDPEQRRRIGQLRAGWRLPGLGTPDRLVAEAAAFGLSLRKDLDLTEHSRPGSRLRDRLISLVSPLLTALDLASVPFFGNMIGGHALQIGLAEGYVRYRLLVFEGAAGSTEDEDGAAGSTAVDEGASRLAADGRGPA